jgi:pyrimidine operon attenuation protein/uracil phosphoribosyltransferase
MTGTSTLILDRKQTLQKIKRIAFEIYENNFQEEDIVLAGIYDQGYQFAQLLEKELHSIAPLKIILVKVTVEKFVRTQAEVRLDCSKDQLRNKSIILIDDVLNTGRTFAHSLKPFLEIETKKIQTAVVVDRSHRLFPVSADYVGYALSTTIQEHIEVILDQSDRLGVYLS